MAAFARASFQQQLAYRVANWAGLFTNGFFLFFRAYMLVACYAERTDIGGLSVSDALTYCVVTQAILMVAPQWGTVGVSDSVRTGQVAVDLLRPVDYVGMVVARRLGVSGYYALVRMGPLLALGAVCGLLTAPVSVGSAVAFAVSLVMSACISCCVLFLIEVTSFWLEADKGVRLVVLGASLLPSGLILPLAYFPEPVQWLCRLTPFPYTLYLPAEIWMGQVQGLELVASLGAQLAWAVGLVVACRWAFARGTRRLLVLGG